MFFFWKFSSKVCTVYMNSFSSCFEHFFHTPPRIHIWNTISNKKMYQEFKQKYSKIYHSSRFAKEFNEGNSALKNKNFIFGMLSKSRTSVSANYFRAYYSTLNFWKNLSKISSAILQANLSMIFFLFSVTYLLKLFTIRTKQSGVS